MADPEDALDDLEETLNNLQKEVEARIDPVLDQISNIATLEQENRKLKNDVKELGELLDASQKEVVDIKLQARVDEQTAEDTSKKLRRDNLNLEADNKKFRAERGRLIHLVGKTIDLMDDCLFRLPDFRLKPPDVAEQTNPSEKLSPARGVFICCEDEFFAKQNSRRFERFKKMEQELQINIDFGERPLFVRSSMEYPPIPEGIDVAVIFTAGLTHTDSKTLCKNAKNKGAHVIRHQSVAFIGQELQEWRKNPQFVHS